MRARAVRQWTAAARISWWDYAARRGGRTHRRAPLQPDEYVILSPQRGHATCVESEHGGGDMPGYSVVIVPPGRPYR